MKYYYFTFIAAVFLAFAADSTAQDHRSSIRSWNEGRLTWDDFRQESFHADSIASAIYWSFETFPVKKRYGNLTVSKLESHLLMDKTLSWVRPDCMTGHYLKYPQIIFDIAELYRRKFQSEIDRTPNLYRQLFSFYDNACDKSIEEFKFLSDSGDNTEQISIYERKINKELENSAAADSIPKFSCKNFGASFNAGVNCEVFYGNAGKLFSPATLFNLGTSLSYKESFFDVEMLMGGGKVRNTFTANDYTWDKGDGYSHLNISLQYTYALFDNDNWKIGPFIGIGGLVHSCNKTEEEREDENIDNTIGQYNAMAGVNISWKIRRRLSLVYGFPDSKGNYMENMLRFKIYAARSQFCPDFAGYSINFSLTFSVFARLLK